ncbi:MAG: DUF1622 domain-containing protein [Lentimicrobiaceae bacterium]|jgi:uncharacterized membrane protein|nr:DUF1622 domain-containing protein [Lentimicrobiaceae bacterium]
MKIIIEYISQGIAFISIAIIVYGTILALARFAKNMIKTDSFGIRNIRASFGGYLLLGLELLIGADIIKTIVEPTYQELIILAGIVILRTILAIFLNKEIKDIESK